jgi:hypothetical protein
VIEELEEVNGASKNEDHTGSSTSSSGILGLMVAHLVSGNVSGGQEMAGFEIQRFKTSTQTSLMVCCTPIC